MSHFATNWAFQQKGLRPALKVVLLYLADRHNPDYGCFPSQERLARDAEMSRASVNRHLKALEEMGLIRRVRRTDSTTGRVLATRYLLAFEDDFDPPPDEAPCLEMTHGPCLKLGDYRVSNCDTNLVREPVRMMMTKRARKFRASLLKVLGADPETGMVRVEGHILGMAADMAEADRWLGDLGLSEAECLDILRDVLRRAPQTPHSFRYFREAMRAFAARKQEAPLTPKAGWAPKPVPTIRAQLPEEYRKKGGRE